MDNVRKRHPFLKLEFSASAKNDRRMSIKHGFIADDVVY